MPLNEDQIQVFAEGVGRCEGPVLRSDGQLVITSMSHGCLYIIDQEGRKSIFADTGGVPNGIAIDVDDTLYIAQTGARGPEGHSPGGVQRVTADGIVTWIADDPISPNDICFGPDGLLYVTDPSRKPIVDGRVLSDGRLFTVDPVNEDCRMFFSTDYYPNGIGFGPLDGLLYVADTSGSHIVRYRVDGPQLKDFEVFAESPYGHPDGFAFDADGRLFVCSVRLDNAPGELQVFEREGSLIERLQLGEDSLYTNLAFDDAGNAYLTVTDGGTVLRISNLTGRGAALYPSAAARVQA